MALKWEKDQKGSSLSRSLLNFTDQVLEVIKDMPAWQEGGEYRRYFGLKTVMRESRRI